MPEDLQQEYEETFVPQQTSDKPIKNDAEIAKLLLDAEAKTAVNRKIIKTINQDGTKKIEVADVPNTFAEMITRDLVKANLNLTDLRVCRQIGILSSYVQSISDKAKINYEEFQKFLYDIGVYWLNSSRARDGWASALSKTDTSVMKSTLENIQMKKEEKQKSKWRFW